MVASIVDAAIVLEGVDGLWVSGSLSPYRVFVFAYVPALIGTVVVDGPRG